MPKNATTKMPKLTLHESNSTQPNSTNYGKQKKKVDSTQKLLATLPNTNDSSLTTLPTEEQKKSIITDKDKEYKTGEISLSKSSTNLLITIEHLQDKYIKLGLVVEDLKNVELLQQSKTFLNSSKQRWRLFSVSFFLVFLSVFYQINILTELHSYMLGVCCIIPNNYFIWEATRPISDCNFCSNITEALILPNLTRGDFTPYAYSSRPMVLKGAFKHWHAITSFNFEYFKNLYASIEGSYKSVDEECQFLHFKSDFISIRDVFEMSPERIKNEKGQKSWYVGWGNCHPEILEEMHKEYPKPHFLPKDSEVPYKDYVFMGYDDGATMHLDYINRLMWQAQLQGSKIWKILPPPECQHICQGFNFTVSPGDAVLVDTRMWYHGTTIFPGEFSISVQSEYG